MSADTGTCGGASITLPFTDVPSSNIFFCAIAEAYFSGLTNGTSATTYSPANNVPREQMAAFVTRTLDQSLKRGSLKGALDQWAMWSTVPSSGRVAVGGQPQGVKSDGADLWVANLSSNTVSRVRASDGRLLETWTGATNPRFVLAYKGRIFVTGSTNPGRLYVIDPSQPAGNVTVFANNLGDDPFGIAGGEFYVWTANFGGSISRVDPVTGSVTNYVTGFVEPRGIIFDGSNLWVTDSAMNALLKVSNGAVVQAVLVGDAPHFPIFDGTNIWVPNYLSDSVTVVRASTGTVLAVLTGNGLNNPVSAAFDGERILITNSSGDSVSLWKATDLTPLGSFTAGNTTRPYGACSDGINFWITLADISRLARY
jgi:sugar lactone lactonase YvrE